MKPLTIIRFNGDCRGFEIERRRREAQGWKGELKIDSQGEVRS